MATPDYEDLVAALLGATPKGYRQRKPDQALARAVTLAKGALANWPKAPVRQRVLQAGITVVGRDSAFQPVELAAGQGSVELEVAGVVVHALHRRGEVGTPGMLNLRIDPLGRDYLVRLNVTEFGFHSHQAVVQVAGAAPAERI